MIKIAADINDDVAVLENESGDDVTDNESGQRNSDGGLVMTRVAESEDIHQVYNLCDGELCLCDRREADS